MGGGGGGGCKILYSVIQIRVTGIKQTLAFSVKWPLISFIFYFFVRIRFC